VPVPSWVGEGVPARLTAPGVHCVKAVKKDAVGGADFTHWLQ